MTPELLATVIGAAVSAVALLAHGVVTLRAGAARETRLEASIEAVRVATTTHRTELERQIREARAASSEALERHERSADEVHERHERRLNSHATELREHGVAIAEIRVHGGRR